MSRKAFTLVELLVVITIIGILTGLVTAAAVAARRRAKIATVVMEVKQLESACQAYKEKFGEYPPDFCGLANITLEPSADTNAVSAAAKRAILRHLARAFPRYQPGVSKNWTGIYTGWNGFLADVLAGWSLDVSTNPGLLSPASAMTFWLGGMPSWLADTTGSSLDVTLPNGTTKVLSTQPVSGFLGFSANPADPFDNSASRIQPFYDFNLTCLLYSVPTVNNPGGIEVWPSNACDKTVSPPCPIVYFRAENTNYTVDGATPNLGGGRQRLPSYQNLKCWPPLSSTTSATPSAACVCPAADSRLSQFGTQSYIWVNPASFQIFSAGLDATYGNPFSVPMTIGKRPMPAFPTGENYAPYTYDDITNFSNGTLEDAIP